MPAESSSGVFKVLTKDAELTPLARPVAVQFATNVSQGFTRIKWGPKEGFGYRRTVQVCGRNLHSRTETCQA